MSVKLKIGGLCRLADGSPARYVGNGIGLNAVRTGMRFGVAQPPTGGEDKGMLPTDREVFTATKASDEELSDLLAPRGPLTESEMTTNWEHLKGLKY